MDNSPPQALPLIREEFMQEYHLRPSYKQPPGIFQQSSNGQVEQNWPGTALAVENACPARPKEERLSVPPLCTIRLLPTRYKTKNAIMSILRNGEVVLEFLKFRPKLNEDRISDICRISHDGRRIIIYQPDPGR